MDTEAEVVEDAEEAEGASRAGDMVATLAIVRRWRIMSSWIVSIICFALSGRDEYGVDAEIGCC